MEQTVLVSFFIIARNAEATLPGLLQDLKAQNYPAKQMELILCDSLSEDGTKAVFESFSRENAEAYHRICLLENKGGTLPHGWNTCLLEATGELIIRVDAHSSLPSDFVRSNVISYLSGHDVSGGPRTSIASEKGAWQQTLLVAENSLFGSGLAGYRHEQGAKETDTVAHGAYARYVFETVGGYDERLTRTEDNEMHHRIRKAGFHIYTDPTIRSWHRIRSCFPKMLRQKYANGYWIGLTLGVVPGCIRLFHLVPGCFVLGLIFCGVLALLGIPLLLQLCLGAYMLVNFLMSALAWIKEKPFTPAFFLLPFLFFMLHLAYGAGTLVGLIKLPFWKKNHKSCEAKERVRLALIANNPKKEENS